MLALGKGHNLGREITITLVIKIAVIWLLWLWFFSEPVDDGLTGADVGRVLFDAPEEKVPAPMQMVDKP